MGAFTLASVWADAAAVVEALWVAPAGTLIGVSIRAGSPCKHTEYQQQVQYRQGSWFSNPVWMGPS